MIKWCETDGKYEQWRQILTVFESQKYGDGTIDTIRREGSNRLIEGDEGVFTKLI